MPERWKEIPEFPVYSVSTFGRVQNANSGLILALNENQFGVMCVGLMRDGIQWHRSVPLLVARAFIPRPSEPFDTPINLDGDRTNNHVDNLIWRPRWFAIRYNQQFKWRELDSLDLRIMNLDTGEISENSFECAIKYGILERDLLEAIDTDNVVWPIYQRFTVLID
jgi:hypothetical protein